MQPEAIGAVYGTQGRCETARPRRGVTLMIRRSRVQVPSALRMQSTRGIRHDCGMTYTSSPELRERVANCLNEFLDSADLIAAQMMRAVPAGMLRVDPERPDSNTAAATVIQHRAVASDHFSAFADLLRSETPHGPSLAALLRSGLETWGRAWWVLTAPSPTQAEYRAKAMIVDELATATRRGIRLLSGVPIEEGLKRMTEVRDQVAGGSSEPVPRYSALAADMLSACGDLHPMTTYSHLSGVAHGESAFTASLSDSPLGPAGTVALIALPTRNLATYSTSVFGITAIGMSKLIAEWDVEPGLVVALQAAIKKAAAGLGEVEEFAGVMDSLD
jgi:hypothetical protein